jgi:hypothetical protein
MLLAVEPLQFIMTCSLRTGQEVEPPSGDPIIDFDVSWECNPDGTLHFVSPKPLIPIVIPHPL